MERFGTSVEKINILYKIVGITGISVIYLSGILWTMGRILDLASNILENKKN